MTAILRVMIGDDEDTNELIDGVGNFRLDWDPELNFVFSYNYLLRRNDIVDSTCFHDHGILCSRLA